METVRDILALAALATQDRGEGLMLDLEGRVTQGLVSVRKHLAERRRSCRPSL